MHCVRVHDDIGRKNQLNIVFPLYRSTTQFLESVLCCGFCRWLLINFPGLFFFEIRLIHLMSTMLECVECVCVCALNDISHPSITSSNSTTIINEFDQTKARVRQRREREKKNASYTNHHHTAWLVWPNMMRVGNANLAHNNSYVISTIWKCGHVCRD